MVSTNIWLNVKTNATYAYTASVIRKVKNTVGCTVPIAIVHSKTNNATKITHRSYQEGKNQYVKHIVVVRCVGS
jgi:hypothetical protein